DLPSFPFLVQSTMSSNQHDASQEGNQMPPPANETASLRAVNEQQKAEIDKMSVTFKTVVALKNRKIKDLEDQVKQMEEDAMHVDNSAEMDRSVDYVVTSGVVMKLNAIVDSLRFDLSHPVWDKVTLFYGDITQIFAAAMVNATNFHLAGKEGVSGVIHRAAGYEELQAECKKHTRPVATGQAVMTESCGLGSRVRKIIHCVGPICHGGVTADCRNQLESCYRLAMELCEQNGLRSIAFTCISTGIHGYDNKDASRTVLRFLYEHFEKARNVAKWDRVILCLFKEVDKLCYKHYITKLARNPELFDEDDDEE
ncbi:hypothetical protein PRIPAC_83097, partial [Pristionchus pacificus]